MRLPETKHPRHIKIDFWATLTSAIFGALMALSWGMAAVGDLAALPKNHALAMQCLAIGTVSFIFAAALSSMVYGYVDSYNEARKRHDAEISDGKIRAILRQIYGWLFEVRPFIGPLAVLSAVYLLHFVLLSPGILSQEDTKDQLLAFFNLPNFRAQQVTLISPDVLLTNHHPVLHTIVLGVFVTAGMILFGSANIGLLLYTLAQVLTFVISLSCIFPFMRRVNASPLLRWLALVFLTSCPKLWNFSCLATKDVMFSASVVLYLIACADCLVGTRSRKVYARLFCFGCLVCLLRNGGVFLVFVTVPFLLFATKRKVDAVPALASITTYAIVIMLVFPFLHITGGSPRETLSVPLQQTARVLVHHPGGVTEDELEAIRRVADPIEMTKAYRPQLADYVKNLYRSDATADDVSAFLAAWMSIAMRYPGTCIAASVDNHYGFYCFSKSAYESLQSPTWSRKKMEIANEQIAKASDGAIVCDFHELAPQALVDAGTSAYEAICEVPLVAQSMQAAAYFWLLVYVLAYAVSRRNAPATTVCLALLTLYAVSLLGPANAVGYTRYIAPAMVAWPIMLACITKPPTAWPEPGKEQNV